MPSTASKPAVLMTFAANDLKGISKEADAIWNTVKSHAFIQAKKLENAQVIDLAAAILKLHDQLLMFHFGGHADTGHLVLDGFRKLDKVRLGRLLVPKEPSKLQLVFLNGCLSYGHVGLLTAKGVKAIIATNVEVNDTEAVHLASFFYQSFFEQGFTLKAAFEFAEATVQGRNSFPTIVNPGEMDENQPMPASWTLFVNAKYQEVLNWTLQDFIHAATGQSLQRSNTNTNINTNINTNFAHHASGSSSASASAFKGTAAELVAKGRLREALNLLAVQMPNETTIILLQGRLSNLDNSVNMGTLAHAEANIERNRISHAILSFIHNA